MSELQTIKKSLYRIDLETDQLGESIEVGAESDINGYIHALIKELEDKNRQKEYALVSEETEVAVQIKKIKENSECWDESTSIIANRFLRAERKSQDRVKQMNVKLRVGSLMQVLAKVENKDVMIIIKVDHSSYLDEITFKEKNGLPVNKHVRAQKTAIISFDDMGLISEILLSDSNPKIAEYWSDDFLEVEEVNPSEKNTLRAFSAIDNLLNRDLKRKEFFSDYWTIRNAVISYFRTRSSLTLDTLIQDVFDSYIPDNKEVDIDAIKIKIKDLPEKNNFDSQFEITASAIKARVVKQIELASNLELKFTGDVADLDNLIKSQIDVDGKKFIKIYSDEGYRQFKKPDDVN